MDIRGMHYDFKQKLNKIDSQQYRNLRIPEIDWHLNEALDVFIKSIAEPRINNHLGFETSQRSTDDIRTLVTNKTINTFLNGSDETKKIVIPIDYMFFVSAECIISKENCKDKKARIYIRQHDDEFQQSPFDKSSYEWGEVNATFSDDTLVLYTGGDLEIKEVRLNFIKKHNYIHNAQDFLPTGTYNLPSGEVLTGRENCELPEHTHREIVDIAVLIATGNLQIPDYQIKQAKLNLNQIN